MQIITQDVNRDIHYNQYFYNKKVCFLDIETTGLSRIYNSIYLVGILYFENNRWKLTQILADSLMEENSLLNELMEFISPYNEIITYNGDSFDIPFINERAKKYTLPEIISKEYSTDLYRIVKNNKHILNLDNLKLKSLERYLGIYREDIYTGKECIGFYLDYTKTKNINQAAKVLKHNFDDLYYMLDIMKILDKIQEKRTLTIQDKNINIKLYIDTLEQAGDLFIINGNVEGNNEIKLIHYTDSYKISLERDKFQLILEYSLGLVKPDEKAMYIDKNKIVLSKDVIDSTIYDLPENIILLKVESQFCIENIKTVILDLIMKSQD